MARKRVSLNSPFYGASSLDELIRIVESIIRPADRVPVVYGVTKVKGKSIERTRREANAAAMSLLDSLPADFDGRNLTDEQRQALAGYTGNGGIGGSEYEYYTPQHVAAGMWDMMKAYGAGTGHILEPSAGAGVFHEEKPSGVLMTAAEISDISGRINQLLHPEDKVNIGAFELVANSTEDETFDHVIGNVPFADNRGAFGNLDPAYADIKNVGHYFVLRTLDKLKAGGLSCLIVPVGFTSGTPHAAFRDQVSRKAEFLGAHRLPSGTFDENGTATPVDVWVLRKHPASLADTILELSESALTSANVLWPTFTRGKWFDLDGRRFQYGETEISGAGAFKRMVVKNDQITNAEMRTKLAHKFDSRINWEALGQMEPEIRPMVDGEKRFIDGVWRVMQDGRLVIDAATTAASIDATKYGAASYGEISKRFSSAQGVITLPFAQLQAIQADYPESIPFIYRDIIKFALGQKPANQARALRGAIIGQQIGILQGKAHQGYSPEDMDQARLEVVKLIQDEIAAGHNPNMGSRISITGGKAADWLRFKGSIHEDGTLSDFLQGKLDTTGGKVFNSDNAEDCIRHLYNDVDRDPITLADLREVFTGTLPDDKAEAMALVASIPGIAVTTDGDMLPMDRATSGDIGLVSQAILGALPYTPDGPIKENYMRQLDEIRQKRAWTNGEDIRFKLDARWHDRRLVREFLHEQGFEPFEYVQSVQVEEGQVVSDLSYSGPDGVFIGYRYKTVNTTDKETGQIVPVYKANTSSDPFGRQLETYLNGGKPRGPNQADYIEKIRGLEEDFNVWVRSHDNYDDLVQQYNDAFNKDIRFQHSDQPLGLVGISGKRTPFGYQNEEVRRLSEDGRGILGFGTGLGKTTTGIALEAYNFERGRTKRTCFVVPKAVYENWYHEAHDFLSQDALKGYLFVGLDELRGDNGEIRQVPVLDEDGNPVMKDGVAVTRNAVQLSSSDTIKERMNLIPHTNQYRAVVMTKEQYAAIPMRPDTVEEHAQDVLFAAAAAGRVKIDGQTHREANAKNRIVAEASKTGTEKEQNFPYFEDMNFDSVIADEGHNYRNSYGAGREASALAYLPTSAVAQSARDMAVKNAYMMKKNNGRGCVLLTATPLVNSPIDAFNMLSHIIPATEWQRMGIHTPDDFVKMFGKTEEVFVTKVDGTVQQAQGLVGFQNLQALRGIFNRWTTMKNAQDVSNEVKIPDLEEVIQDVPMTVYQETVYEELRLRALMLANPNSTPFDEAGNPIFLRDGKGNIVDPKTDSIFSITRDMDRLVTDPDLYHRTMTFRFPVAKLDGVKQLVNALPQALTIKGLAADEEDEENQAATLTYSLEPVGEYAQLVVPELYEQEVLQRLKSFGLEDKDVSHPIPPKYSKLIDNLKSGLKDGKQIIFSDEKSQHGKLKRILAQALGMELDQIGILNATTVADAAKGKKIKPVKKPDEPDENASAEKMADYYVKQRAYEDYIAAVNEVRLGGLEQIAADYNEGRTRIIICNKKAEVGINLHKGTSDIHHLTFPWTPASINQRNGRGARVGSTAEKVRAHYYCGKGSFDEFRLNTIKRKGNWIAEVMTSDAAEMENADANNEGELLQLIAANDAEREQQRQAQINRIKAVARVKAINNAKATLTMYIKAKHAASTNSADIQKLIDDLDTDLAEEQIKLDKARADLEKNQKSLANTLELLRTADEQLATGNVDRWDVAQWKRFRTSETTDVKNSNAAVSEALRNIGKINEAKRRQQRVLVRIDKAEKEIRRYRPEVERAVRDGYLVADTDLIDHADEYYIDAKNDNMYRAGNVHEWNVDTYKRYVRIEKLDVDTGDATVREIFTSRGDVDVATKPSRVNVRDLGPVVDYSEDEISLRSWMQGGKRIDEMTQRLSKAQFHDALRNGWLTFVPGSNIIYRTENGFSTQKMEKGSMGTNNVLRYDMLKWLVDNADAVLYPDTSDHAMLTAVAGWLRKASYQMSYLTGYLRALFGSDYLQAMASFGEQAPVETIRTMVTDLMDKNLIASESEKANRQGNAPGQLYDAFTTQGFTGDMWILRNSGRPQQLYGDYANQKDFDDQYAQIRASISATLATRIQANASKKAEDIYAMVKALVGGDAEEALKRVEEKTRSIGRGVALWQLSYQLTPSPTTVDEMNLAQMLADAVIADLCNLSDINPQTIRMPILRQDLLAEINKRWRVSRENLTEWMQEARFARGLISQEQLDAAKQKQAELVEEQSDAAENPNLIIKKNASKIRGKRFGYESGECWCLHDLREGGGALRDAKDELKNKYGANYYSNKRDRDAELVGSWWLIDAGKVTAGELAAIVANYE